MIRTDTDSDKVRVREACPSTGTSDDEPLPEIQKGPQERPKKKMASL